MNERRAPTGMASSDRTTRTTIDRQRPMVPLPARARVLARYRSIARHPLWRPPKPCLIIEVRCPPRKEARGIQRVADRSSERRLRLLDVTLLPGCYVTQPALH